MHPLSVRKGEMISNTLPFSVDTLPECLEKEPNDSTQTAQAVTLPVIVNGRIDRPDDGDVFRFEGRAGQEIVVEVAPAGWNRRWTVSWSCSTPPVAAWPSTTTMKTSSTI